MAYTCYDINTDSAEYQRLVAEHGHWNAINARAHAFVMNSPIFPGGCDHHGETVCSTATGACIGCYGHLRQAAKDAGRQHFTHSCYACRKPTLHRTRDEQCLECLPTRGTSARADARRRGLKSFDAYCEPCDAEGPHSVAHGSCLTCHTSNGTPRKSATRGRPARDANRAAARREGAWQYVATCWLHGTVPHSVQWGKCLTCYNTLGVARPGFAQVTQPVVANRRADARRDGYADYQDYCETCNDDVPHSVKHGTCLTCCTSGGVRRTYKPRAERPEDDWDYTG